ncbi:MAG: orotate phosphoribosyltransferase [Desulfovibrionaceae bacterium]|nr:orotate phosphoribosyltransferase [Desulfovibrionaceae bacterium]
MMNERIASILLETKAVQFSKNGYFTFASGIQSPIYCDNRILLAHPGEREYVVSCFVESIQDSLFDVIAGTATAGIPWASFVADKKRLPMCYVRSAPKSHGKGKQVEGCDVDGKHVALIEDLISTGGSVATASRALVESGAKSVAVFSIFSYGLSVTISVLRGIEHHSLCDLPILLQQARSLDILSEEEIHTVERWQSNPTLFS